MSEPRECFDVVRLDVIAAECGWQRDYDLEANEEDRAAASDSYAQVDAAVYTCPLPNYQRVYFVLAYGRRDGARSWQLVGEDGLECVAHVLNDFDGPMLTERRIRMPVSTMEFWLQRDGADFLRWCGDLAASAAR